MDGGLRILPLAAPHAGEVARLHRAGLPKGFLSTLGEAFLARLYLAIAAQPRGAVFVAVHEGRCVGFVSGCLNVRELYRGVVRQTGWALLRLALPRLVAPAVIQHCLQTILYPFRRQAGAQGVRAVDETDTQAELLSIAVASGTRGLGVGRRLVERLERSYGEWHYDGSYRVVTDAEDPRSNAFYLGIGFAHVERFRHHGHPMNLYRKPLVRPLAVQEHA